MAAAAEDLAFTVDRALDGMLGIVAGLGDDLANQALDLPGTNTPYAIVWHCCGVVEYWGGEVLAGRDVDRDRDAEFRARGTVEQLRERVAGVKRRLRADLEHLDQAAPPRRPPSRSTADDEVAATQLRVVLHVLEDVAQHHGQLEVTRDVLLAR